MKKSIILISLLAAVSVFASGCGASGNKTAEKAPEASESSDYSKFAGDWYVDGSLENGHLSIDPNGKVISYSYEGTVNYEGELKREEYENPDGTTGYLYNIYDGSELVIGFYEPEEADFYELYSGQDGAEHYVRSDHCTEGGTTDSGADISIDLIAGNWDYKVMDQDDPENFILKGNVEITADGSYTYAPIEGDAAKGNVRIEYEEFSDDTIFTMFNFYAEDDSFWIGTYYDENDKDTLWIGNGGEECLVRSGQY